MNDQMPRWSGADPLAKIRFLKQQAVKDGQQQELLAIPEKPLAKWENQDPIATVIPDTPLFHLARGLDYTVPARLVKKVQPGCLVSVKIGDQLAHGWVRSIRPGQPTRKRLRPISRVLSPYPLVSAASFELADQVASRYAGNLSQILTHAIPPRRAGIEKEFFASESDNSPVENKPQVTAGLNASFAKAEPLIANYLTGKELLESLGKAKACKVVWSALPEPDKSAPFSQISQLVASSLNAPGSVLCLFPTGQLAKDFSSYWKNNAPTGAPSALEYHFELGTNERYRSFLKCRFNQPRLVVGTRSAVFAPLKKVSLVLIWDEGAESYQEKSAPYWHVRQVGMLRAGNEKCSLILGSFSRSPQAQALVMSSWAHELTPRKQQVQLPKIYTPEYEDRDDLTIGRVGLSSTALQFLHNALEHGPVLIQSPRKGGRLGLSCANCLAPVRCPQCFGTVQQLRGEFICNSCGHHFQFRCSRCGGQVTRAAARGNTRISEEIGAAFPKIPVINCDADNPLQRISAEPALVVSTTEQEPVAEGGYAGALLLDTGMLLSLDQIWTAEEALRRWANAAAKVAPGGGVMLSGDPGRRLALTFKQRAFSQWASQELQERAEVGIPPTAVLATIRADQLTLRKIQEVADFADAQVIGPSQIGEQFQLLVRSRLDKGEVLRQELQRIQAVASRKKWGSLKVQVDPLEL